MKRRRLTPYALMSPGLFWLLIFFAIPMAFMLIVALEEGSIDTGFSLTWQWSNFSESVGDFSTQFGRSFKFSIIATLLCLLIAYPLAYAIAFKAGRWKNLMLFAVVAPFFTTYLIRTLAWQTILTDSGFIADVARFFAFIPEDGKLLDTDSSVIMGITYNFLPFMVLPIYASLEQLDERLIEAAKDLYSNARSAFFKVTLPLSAPGIIAGTLLTFIPAFGDYVNATFLGGPNQAMIGNVIQDQYLRTQSYPTAAALSFVVMAVILAIVLIYIRFAGSESLMGEDQVP
jgi:spermidine/putrescine transport system permease protein